MKSALALAIGACTLAALVAAERVLARRDAHTPSPVEHLVPPEMLAGRTTAAFSLESGGNSLLYLRAKGLWRCTQAYGAVCEGERVEAMLSSVLDTRGTLVCTGQECAARAGLDEPDALKLGLHGPKVLSSDDRDAIALVTYAPPRPGATFARLEGTQRVLAADRDPRAFLDATNRPAPLVDTRVLAGCFAPGFAGFERIFVDRGEQGFELASEEPSAPDQERRWSLVEGGTRRETILWRIGGYVSLWVRVRWQRVEDPRQVAALGLDPPFARVTLAPNVGQPVEVLVSAADAANRVYVWNKTTNVVASVGAELLPLLVPQPDDFTRAEGANPWEAWLVPR